MREVVKITIGENVAESSLLVVGIAPELHQITRRGYSVWPRSIRASLSRGAGNPIVMESARTVAALASTASPSARTLRRRALSAGEEKSEGVLERVEMRPSQVRAKFARTRGREVF